MGCGVAGLVRRRAPRLASRALWKATSLSSPGAATMSAGGTGPHHAPPRAPPPPRRPPPAPARQVQGAGAPVGHAVAAPPQPLPPAGIAELQQALPAPKPRRTPPPPP